jgi:hypothetical protein
VGGPGTGTPKCPTQMRGARAVRLPQNGIVMPDIRDPVVPTWGPFEVHEVRTDATSGSDRVPDAE